jgi:hypothetical protein
LAGDLRGEPGVGHVILSRHGGLARMECRGMQELRPGQCLIGAARGGATLGPERGCVAGGCGSDKVRGAPRLLEKWSGLTWKLTSHCPLRNRQGLVLAPDRGS